MLIGNQTQYSLYVTMCGLGQGLPNWVYFINDMFRGLMAIVLGIELVRIVGSIIITIW